MAPGQHRVARSPSPTITCETCNKEGNYTKDGFYSSSFCSKACYESRKKPAYEGRGGPPREAPDGGRFIEKAGFRDTRCFDFMRGRCNRGSSCRFSHDDAGGDRGRDDRGRDRRPRSRSRDRRDARRGRSRSRSRSRGRRDRDKSESRSRRDRRDASKSKSPSSSPERPRAAKKSSFAAAPAGYVAELDHHGNPTNIPPVVAEGDD